MEEDLLTLSVQAFVLEYQPPQGARAAMGTAAGLAVASIAAAVWSKIENDNWDANEDPTRRTRWWLAVAHTAAATLGASMATRPGTRGAAGAGAAVGSVLAQVPIIWDPELLNNHPFLANVMQYGLPIAGAVIGVNVVR